MRRWLAVGVLAVAFMGAVASPASAQVQVDGRYMTPVTSTGTGEIGAVLATGGQRAGAAPQAVPTQVLAAQGSTGSVGAAAQIRGLAFTGADILTLVAIGISLTLVGAVLARRARPRSLPEA